MYIHFFFLPIRTDVALTRAVEVLPSINSNSQLSKVERSKVTGYIEFQIHYFISNFLITTFSFF